MFNFCSLYSGSTGNCLFVETEHTKLLVDAGVSAKKIMDGLSSIHVDFSDIDAVLVTHEHVDHVQSLGTISKKFDIPVFANADTWDAMPKQKDKIADYNVKHFLVNESFEIGDLKVLPFSIPHVTTDILNHLDGSNFLMLEANYDPEVLKCGPYPFLLKSRIAGPNRSSF